MSDPRYTGPGPNQLPPYQGPGVSDVVIQLQGIVRQLSSLVTAIGNVVSQLSLIASSKVKKGTFQLGASVSTVVADTSVTGTSEISWSPTNAAAGTLEGSTKKLYLSARSPGVSFTVTTASGVAAAGTETFQYMINNQ